MPRCRDCGNTEGFVMLVQTFEVYWFSSDGDVVDGKYLSDAGYPEPEGYSPSCYECDGPNVDMEYVYGEPILGSSPIN